MLNIGLPYFIENEICKQIRLQTAELSPEYNRVVRQLDRCFIRKNPFWNILHQEYRDKLKNLDHCIDRYNTELMMTQVDDPRNNLNWVDFIVLPLIQSDAFVRSVIYDDELYINVYGHNGLKVECEECFHEQILTFDNKEFSCVCTEDIDPNEFLLIQSYSFYAD